MLAGRYLHVPNINEHLVEAKKARWHVILSLCIDKIILDVVVIVYRACTLSITVEYIVVSVRA